MKWLVKAGCLVDEGFVTWEIEASDPAEAEMIGCGLARKSSVADSGNVTVEPLEEDKQLICDKLLEVLQITLNLHDVLELTYDPKTETVTAFFETGHTKTANVAMDSGTAMIKDIVSQII